MSDTCTLSQLSPMSLTVLYQYHQDEWYLCSITVITCLTTVSVSPRWVIPVLYHSYHLCLWLYCISITKMSDTCALSQLSPVSTVSVSPRWVIPLLYHSYHLCLWLLYQYHQDEWYLYSITVITYVSDCTVSVSPRWVIPVLYHSYHLCLWLYCISITKMSDTCTISQLSPMSDYCISITKMSDTCTL